MKVKYKGQSFYNGFGLTDNTIYECTGVDDEAGLLYIIDDEGEECGYPIISPRPIDNPDIKGEWEIVEDNDNQLKDLFTKHSKA